MKRIAQTQDTYNDGSIEQSVMLSPRVLLTGPRQIVRLERQYRSLSEDLQNAFEDLTRSKDAYVSALQNFEQAELYIKQLAVKTKNIVFMLNNASSNKQYLDQAASEIQMLTSGTGNTPSEGTRQAQSWFDKASSAVNNPSPAGTVPNTGQNTTAVPTQSVSTNNTQQTQEQAYAAQQTNMLKSQLSAFANEMYRRYTAHKKRAADMENQYNMSKSNYAKTRGEFFALQTEIGNLNSSLADWNERLSEYYMPAAGGE